MIAKDDLLIWECMRNMEEYGGIWRNMEMHDQRSRIEWDMTWAWSSRDMDNHPKELGNYLKCSPWHKMAGVDLQSLAFIKQM